MRPFAWNIFPTIDSKDGKKVEISTSNDSINVVTIKRAKQKEGYVIRLQNCSCAPQSTYLSIDSSKICLDFGKFEVKTVIYNDGEFEEVTDMVI